MADLQQIVGAVVRRERQERRLTMKELAARSSVSEVYLGEIERGKKYPSALVLEQLARALNMEAADLLELVAEALREADRPVVTHAIGFAARPAGRHDAPLPDHPTVTRAVGFAPEGQGAPRLAVKRLAQALGHEDVTMMAQIGAIFLSRREDETTER